MKSLVAGYLARLGLSGATVEIARGHKIRFRRGGETIASERVALVGDAAGLADEFTEEGISYAIHSGKLAARNALRALGGNGDLRGYQTEVEAEIQPELAAARTIAYVFYGMLRRARRPWMFASAHVPFLWGSFFAAQRATPAMRGKRAGRDRSRARRRRCCAAETRARAVDRGRQQP